MCLPARQCQTAGSLQDVPESKPASSLHDVASSLHLWKAVRTS